MQLIELPVRRVRRQTEVASGARGSCALSDRLKISFEFLPPDTSRREEQVWSGIARLAPLQPVNIAITHRASNSADERTQELIRRIGKSFPGLSVSPHLTCHGASREQIVRTASSYWESGVRDLVALRGDPPPGSEYKSRLDGFGSTAALVGALKDVGPFNIAVSAYPEKHPLSPSFDFDLDLLKAKIDSGATSCITQYFFDNEIFLRFRDRLRAAGIMVPIIPGVLPLYNLNAMTRSALRANVTIPNSLARRAAGLESDFESRRIVGTILAAEQIADLLQQGETHVHLYTLNRADLVYAICHMLGLRQEREHY